MHKLEYSVHKIDVQQALANKLPVEDVVSCKDGPPWYVVGKPFGPADDVTPEEVLQLAHGEYATVPLYPFRMAWDPVVALGFVSQLTFAVASLLPGACKLHLALGFPLETVESAPGVPGYKLWLGFALASTQGPRA